VGDVTARATIPPDAAGRAELVARADGVVAGLWLVAEVYAQLDPEVRVVSLVSDGDRVTAGDVLATVTGPLRAILTGERTALNLVTHLSGVATATRALVDVVAGTGCVVRDTRKTIPGLRLLQKAAVAAGGGVNHRLGLSDALLVKDNHVAAAGSVTAAVPRPWRAPRVATCRSRSTRSPSSTRRRRGRPRRAAGQPRSRGDPAGRRALPGWSDEHGERILLESSGTIRHDTVRAYAEAGVDRVAVGAITHSAPQLDLALDVALEA
jgi:nicotinate-nucleotide pyrophosphorylase (carboxylating)